MVFIYGYSFTGILPQNLLSFVPVLLPLPQTPNLLQGLLQSQPSPSSSDAPAPTIRHRKGGVVRSFHHLRLSISRASGTKRAIEDITADNYSNFRDDPGNYSGRIPLGNCIGVRQEEIQPLLK